ncbi:DUF2782 domain-containing protein [Schlegelella sp. S2-27]|uniref:DUF2782 domain-containing protein n=1 Tax=Caldimonas mangrovi TaxID=2944811 RepID=A0ABT0YGV7_9BURK|nr:DUF2782 domain-containing protein [Caldimonas mangrovi]MCM5677952.1 DUF2782 domain-containing protein [Caldimonas mangrovi]
MKRFPCLAATATLLTLCTAAARAQEVTSSVPEPAVQHTVIEDDRARIEELRVRGQNQRITVQPKKGGKAYEVLPADGSRDLSSESTRGAAGQRVWHLFSF